MRRTHLLPLALALLACRTARPPAATAATSLPTPEAPAPGAGDVLVRAREAPVMPTCEAADAVSVAALSVGVPARPSIARLGAGGLVAFVTDPHGDGATKVNLLALGADASPTDERGLVRPLVELGDTGASPAYPALAAFRQGYLLAWRQGAGGQQRVMVRTLDAQGIPSGDARAVGTPGWLGAPALLVTGDRWHVAVARGARRVPGAGDDGGPAWASHLDLVDQDGATRTVEAPEGAAFDGRAPALVQGPSGPRVYVTAMRRGASPGDERALLRWDGDGALAMVARDLDAAAALPLAGATLVAWRARMTRHDASIRSSLLPFEGEAPAPPVTLSTYRGAFEAAPALAALGGGLVGAFTVSTLADDAAGSLNVSLLDERGGYVGRAPILTGFPARSAAAAVAGPPAGSNDRSAWFAIDGRDAASGAPKLLLTRASCDPSRPAERLDVPPGTLVQDLTPAGDAALSLARGAPELACQVRASGAFTPHASGSDDVLAGTAGAVAVTPGGAVLMAVTKAAGNARPRLMMSTLDAGGRLAPPRAVMDNPTGLLALEPVPGGALAVATYAFQNAERMDLVSVRGAAVAHSLMPSGLRNPTSAAILPETGAVFVAAESDAGDAVLAQVPVTAGRAGAPVTLARLRRGDAVLDVLRQGSETHVLLGRPDPLGGPVAQSIARVVVTDGARPPEAARNARDPFADPLGHARGSALWLRVANAPALVYDEGSHLRVGSIADAQVRTPRSALELLPGGGDVLATAWSGRARWLALATGYADEAHATLRPVTLAALDDRGEVRGVTTRLPEDANAVVQGTALGAHGDRVVVLHPRTERGGGMTWAWVDATCPLPGGSR